MAKQDSQKHSQEKWKQLCRKAVKEKDPHRLMDLVSQIEKELQKQDAVNRTLTQAAPPPR